jgi:ADP-heptose:LPS heptosyltransferase
MTPPVVVSRCDRLGDLVLSLPAMGHLARAGFAERILHCAPYAADVGRWALHNGIVTALWLSNEAPPPAARGAVGLALFHSPVTAQAFRAARLSYTLGPRAKLSALWAYSRSVAQRRSRVEKSEMRYNVDLAHALVQAVRARDSCAELTFPEFRGLPALRVRPEWEAALEASFAARSEPARPGVRTGAWDTLLVVSNGGSAANLPMEFYLDLARARLARGERVGALVSGLDAEARRAAFAQSGLLQAGLTLVPELPSVGALIALLARAGEVVASSTGPLHLAHAAGVPVRGLYPSRPRQETFARWRPDGYDHAAPVRYQIFNPSEDVLKRPGAALLSS